MSKYTNALKAVYNGFLPVSQIKGTFVVAIGLYLVFLSFHVKDNFNMLRSVPIENKQDSSLLVMNRTTYAVPYTKLHTLVSLKINTPLEFLFVSSGDIDESFLTALVKIIACVMALILLWRFDFTDPFNVAFYKQVNTLAWLGLLVIVTAFIKDFYTDQWFKDTYHYASGFKYSWSFAPFLLIPAIWALRAVTVFYQSAVKSRQEAELTI